MNPTGADAAAIGARLALKNGTAEAIAIIQEKLAVIDGVLAANAEVTELMTRLGERLQGVDSDRAPLRSPAGTKPLVADQPEPVQQYRTMGMGIPREAVGRPSRSFIRTASVTVPPVSSRTPSIDASLDSKPASVGTDATASPQALNAEARPFEDFSSSVTTVTMAPDSQSGVALPAIFSYDLDVPTVPPATPQIASQSAPSQFDYRQVIEEPTGPHLAAPSAAPLPNMSHQSPTERTGWQRDTSDHKVIIGAVAPVKPAGAHPTSLTAQTAPSMRYAGSFEAPPHHSAVVEPKELGELPDARAHRSEQSAMTESQQGMLILDGVHLGRWVIGHLARYASRPGAGTTGIDPRMNATYPGAPSGA